MKTNHRAAIFGLYRKVGIQKGQGELCSTLEHYPKDNREIDKDLQAYLLPRGLSVFRPSGEVQEIFITRSPISALSHKQLHGAEHTLYLSTCGTITKDIEGNLEEILLQAKVQSIVVKLGFDVDEKGREMAQQVAAIASKQGVTCQMVFPKVGKDWNDMLLATKQQSKQLDLPKPTSSLGRSL